MDEERTATYNTTILLIINNNSNKVVNKINYYTDTKPTGYRMRYMFLFILFIEVINSRAILDSK